MEKFEDWFLRLSYYCPKTFINCSLLHEFIQGDFHAYIDLAYKEYRHYTYKNQKTYFESDPK